MTDISKETQSLKNLINGSTVIRLATEIKLQEISLMQDGSIDPGYSCKWNTVLSSKCYNIQVK